MIPIKKEHHEMYAFTGMYERCHFCNKQTDTWHDNTNNPVCFNCAKTHKVAELPDYGQEIRKNKLKIKGNQMKEHECQKCGHKWLPRVKKPVQCPHCKTQKWNIKAPAKQAG